MGLQSNLNIWFKHSAYLMLKNKANQFFKKHTSKVWCRWCLILGWWIMYLNNWRSHQHRSIFWNQALWHYACYRSLQSPNISLYLVVPGSSRGWNICRKICVKSYWRLPSNLRILWRISIPNYLGWYKRITYQRQLMICLVPKLPRSILVVVILTTIRRIITKTNILDARIIRWM